MTGDGVADAASPQAAFRLWSIVLPMAIAAVGPVVGILQEPPPYASWDAGGPLLPLPLAYGFLSAGAAGFVCLSRHASFKAAFFSVWAAQSLVIGVASDTLPLAPIVVLIGTMPAFVGVGLLGREWRLTRERNRAIEAAWQPPASADHVCERCGKVTSGYWPTECQHCGARFSYGQPTELEAPEGDAFAGGPASARGHVFLVAVVAVAAWLASLLAWSQLNQIQGDPYASPWPVLAWAMGATVCALAATWRWRVMLVQRKRAAQRSDTSAESDAGATR
jgi:hypothetical protein